MFMRLFRCPKPHVLLADMPPQIKMGFVTEQNQAKITQVVLISFTDGLTKFTPFFLIGVSLFLENLHFAWKQLQVIVNDSLHSRSGNVNFLRQLPCLTMLPYCLNISTYSVSNIPSTVTFTVISYTSSVPKFVNNLCYCLSAWSLSPRRFSVKFSRGPLILLKSIFPKFSTFSALKIGLQHPFWCQNNFYRSCLHYP